MRHSRATKEAQVLFKCESHVVRKALRLCHRAIFNRDVGIVTHLFGYTDYATVELLQRRMLCDTIKVYRSRLL
jgi:hypothetical protein